MSFFYKKPVIHFLTILTGFYILYYIWWRAFYTLNPASLIFSLILLIAEVQGVINFFLFALMTWNVEKTTAPAPMEGASVDVYVPTYNEDIKILEATLVGCIAIRYPHTTYVLDDGRRGEVKLLADQLGCKYLTREDNKHAKAGNINAALKQTKGEFIVILDADMVPQPDFIEKTLGYFNDPKTAIVQLPQEFYNLDSVQYSKKSSFWHDQQLFYHVIQPGKNSINSPFWCGSPSFVRRAALESIGGVATESVTEDFLTSIRLNGKGWNIKYHHEVLAFGIAPQSLHAFSLQRMRWAQGSMKILRSKDNPLIAKGLTWKQRLSHFSAIFTYFDAYQKLIYFLAPSLLLLTNWTPVRVDNGIDFMLHWAPYFILVFLTNIALGRGYFRFFQVEKYNTLKMVTFIKASFSLVNGSKTKFKVTPKTVDNSVKKMDRRELRLQIIIFSIIVLSVVMGALNIVFHAYFTYASVASAGVAMFWSIFNLYILYLALSDVLRRKYYRKDYRFPAELDSKVIDVNGAETDAKAIDISMGGMGLIISDPTDIGQTTTLRIGLPNGYICIDGNITYNKELRKGSRKLGIQFIDIPLEDRKRLVYYLFVILPRVQYQTTISRKNVKIPLSDRPFADDLFTINPTLKPNRSEYQS